MRSRIAAFVACQIMLCAIGMPGDPARAQETVGRAAAPAGAPVRAVKRWHYQLQGVDPGAIAASPADMAVIDIDGEDGPFGADDIEHMRTKPDGSRRLVLAYMSIGEAESYRWYWPPRPPAWLGRESRQWRGNYAVRFWHPDWQAIILDYADRIVAAGFDGVYLDRVDMFENLGHAREMVDLVERISRRTKAARGDFVVVAQNGDALIAEPAFRRAIDAFAREDLFYGEGKDGARNTPASIGASLARLKRFAAEGKPVFVVEYPRDDAQAEAAAREIAEHDFIGLIATRALDRP